MNVVEETIEQHSTLGDPLALDPTTAGYEQVLELYLKILRVQKELVEQYRKTKITNIELMEKQSKIELRNEFLEAVEGMSIEQIRELAMNGNFKAANLISANVLAESTLDTHIGLKTMGALAGWNEQGDMQGNIEPSLTINLTMPDGEVKNMDEIDNEVIDLD